MKKFLTGITVSFNSSKVIEKLIDSVEEVINEEIEWIFVDSGSKDGTKDILKNFKKAKVFLFKKNIGFSKANNFAFGKSSGKYLFFCNPDIRFEKREFFKILEEFKSKNPLVLVPELRDYKNKEYYFIRPLPNFKNILSLRWNRGIIKKNEKTQPAFSAIFIEREVFEKLGGFDENFFVYFTDVEFFKRYYREGFSEIHLSDSYFFHEEGSVLKTRKNNFLKFFDFSASFLKFFWKYGSFMDKVISLPFFLLGIMRSLFFYLI